MKTNLLLIILVMLSLVINGLLWYRVSVLEEQAAEYPLGRSMGAMQHYADKLWIAGEADNWQLAHFYHHELEEISEDIIDARVVDEGFAVSHTMSAMMPGALDSVEAAIKAQDGERFRSRYTNLVATCNACHTATNHAFIRIAVPTGPSTFWNQDFTPASTN